MKKIILTLLLTLSALVNVNAVAAFSLDVDKNGSLSSSNDGLVIFKYLLNPDANNLHTTIANDAAEDRKTSAQLKAYLDSAGDILDVDGNQSLSSSNDGLVIFKYLLNPNANNLHTTIANDANSSKTTTIDLKAYLDQYISTAVITTGTATVTGTFKESDSGVGDQNGDGDDLDDGTYVKTFITELIDGVEVDTSKRILIETDYNITNDVDPNLYSGDRPTELTAEQIAAANGAVSDNDHEDVLRMAQFSNYRVNLVSSLKKVYITDTDITISAYATIDLASDFVNTRESLNDAEFQALFLEVIQAIWDLINPVTVESEVAKLYAAEDAPTSLGNVIQDYFVNEVSTGTTNPEVYEDFLKLASENFTLNGFGSNADSQNLNYWYFRISNGDEIETTYGNKNILDHTGSELAEWALAIVQAIWTLEHAPAGPTTISEANKARFDALIGQYGVTQITPMERTAPLALIDVEYNQTDVTENGSSTLNFVFSVQYASWASFPQDRFDTKFDEFVAKLKSDDPNYDPNAELYSGPRPTELTAEQIADANGATDGDEFEHTQVLKIAEYGDYTIDIDYDADDVTINLNGAIVDNFPMGGINLQSLDDESFQGVYLKTIQTIWDLVNPPTPVESEVADIYAADTPPTAYASGSVIDTDAQAVAQEGTVRDTFINRLSSSLYLTSNGYDTATGTGAEIEIRDNNNASLDPAVFVTTDAGTFAGMSGQAFSDFTFKIILAIWHLEHPNYVAPTSHADRAAVLTAYNSIEGISNLTVKLANSNNLSIATVYLTWDLNGVAQALYYFSATNPTSTTDGEVRGDLSYYTPEQFETYRERLYNKLTDHILTPEEIAAALRAERIADLEGLDKDGVTVTQATAQADGFVVSTAGKSDVYFYANDYGSLTFEGLTTDQYTIYTAAIEAKRDEYILAAELAVLRTQRINELEALDKNGVVVVHHTRNNGEDTFSITKNPDQTFIHADVYGPGKVENQDATQYGNYRAAIIAQRDLYDPISDPKLQAVLETFYNGSEAAALDINNYGGQLSAVSTLLATAANAAFDNGLAAQETFLKLLAHGASFQGSPSKVLWDSTGNYYHIVTSNVGSGNGYFDIFLDDNHHYLPNANPGTVMVQNNFRHLAYHVMANLWHLADTTDAELRVFREDWLESYTTQNGVLFAKGKHNNGSDEYRAYTATNSGEAITTLLYGGGVYLVEDLSLTQWVSFRDTYTFSVTTLLGL